jgi:hypothetical protein
VSEYDDFVKCLEGALRDEEGREEFLDYLSALTPVQRSELLAEAERRDPEGAARWEAGECQPARNGQEKEAYIASAVPRLTACPIKPNG